MTLARVYQSGAVRRYHANPAMAHLGQTNADHQGRCVQLLLWLNPVAPAELIRAVAHHDVGERWAGDLPAPFKKAQPEVARAHAEVEASFRAGVFGEDPLDLLDARGHRWLKLVDALEAYAFMLTHAPRERDRNGWPEARKALINMAWQLSDHGTVAAGVSQFLDDLEGGVFG